MFLNSLYNILDDNEKKIYDYLNNEKYNIYRTKSMIFHGSYRNDLFIQNLYHQEILYNRSSSIFYNNIKSKILKNIFNNNKNDKFKINFIKNNNKSCLSIDLLSIIYDYYEESAYLYLLKIDNKYLIIKNYSLLENIFYENNITQIIRINTTKLISQNIIFPYKKLFSYEKKYFQKVILHKNNFNDFYGSCISIKVFYYKKNINNIKYHFFNISSYNDFYIIKNFLKNKKLTKYEFYYIVNISLYFRIDRQLIMPNSIEKSIILSQLDEDLFNLHKISNYKKYNPN